MTDEKLISVLFVCSGNSARSIMAEAIANRLGEGTIEAFSAGSHPQSEVHPTALSLLGEQGHDVASFRPKSWNEFDRSKVRDIDFVITVCNSAASEICPAWPGQPVTAHWNVPDPAAVDDDPEEQRQAFANAYEVLSSWVEKFLDLPLATADMPVLRKKLQLIAEA